MKRSLSLFIAILMVLSSVAAMSFTASAEEVSDFGLAGIQEGENAIRLIGFIDEVEGYDNVGFKVTVAGSVNASKQLDTTTVFTSVTSNGAVVAATEGSGVEAPYIVEHEYLYAFAIKGLADGGAYLFTVVPTATVGEEVVEGAATQIFAEVDNDGAVATAKLIDKKLNVDASKVTYAGGDCTGDGPFAAIFDNNTNSKLCASWNGSVVITWEYDEAIVLTKYVIVSGNDHPGRDPRDWKIYGSNDKETWTVVDEVAGNVFAPNDTNDNRKTPFEFTTDTVTAYKYYKWEVTAQNGNSHFQLMELVTYTAVEDKSAATIEKQALNPEYDCVGGKEHSAGVEGLFDGDLGTKMCRQYGELPITITWEFDAAEVLKKYTFVSGSDHSDHPQRDPVAWTLYGSNDKSAWSEVDSVAGNAFFANSTAYDYTIYENTTAYQYYKLVITENGGNDNVGLPIVQLQEIILYVAE